MWKLLFIKCISTSCVLSKTVCTQVACITEHVITASQARMQPTQLAITSSCHLGSGNTAAYRLGRPLMQFAYYTTASHWQWLTKPGVCNPAYCGPVPSQVNWEGCDIKGTRCEILSWDCTLGSLALVCMAGGHAVRGRSGEVPATNQGPLKSRTGTSSPRLSSKKAVKWWLLTLAVTN